MQEAGLFGRVARQKFPYTEAQLAARMEFALQTHKSRKKRDWMHTMISDEKCFYGKGFCGRTWVRRPPDEAFNPEYCVAKMAHPVKVNVWACFSAAGQGYLHVFYEKMDGALYKSILSDHLLDVTKRDFPSPDGVKIVSWEFLQDNAPMHKSELATEWLHRNGVNVLNFPPYSPDLNPIENLWAIMAREVNQKQCSTIEELSDVVLEVWNNTSVHTFRKQQASEFFRTLRYNSDSVVKFDCKPPACSCMHITSIEFD